MSCMYDRVGIEGVLDKERSLDSNLVHSQGGLVGVGEWAWVRKGAIVTSL